MKKAVFLDRDGVINKAFIKDGLPDVKESILKLKKLNFVCLVVTNQPNVRRGIISKSTVVKMNNYLKKELDIDDFFVCYHDDNDNCVCRKPKPGLLLKARKKWDIDFKKSFLIGDRWRDIIAGENVGCKTIYINYNYRDKQPDNPNFITDTLSNAICIIEKTKI